MLKPKDRGKTSLEDNAGFLSKVLPGIAREKPAQVANRKWSGTTLDRAEYATPNWYRKYERYWNPADNEVLNALIDKLMEVGGKSQFCMVYGWRPATVDSYLKGATRISPTLALLLGYKRLPITWHKLPTYMEIEVTYPEVFEYWMQKSQYWGSADYEVKTDLCRMIAHHGGIKQLCREERVALGGTARYMVSDAPLPEALILMLGWYWVEEGWVKVQDGEITEDAPDRPGAKGGRVFGGNVYLNADGSRKEGT